MKRLMLFAAALLGIGLVAGGPPARAAAPKIHLGQAAYDFGTVAQGAAVTHEFDFENRGDAELVISDVKTSCGCTAAVTSSRTIAPGGRGTLKVTFNSKGRSGPQTKTVTIVSNDPENPRAAIRITGKVNPGKQPVIGVDPMKLDIGVVEPGGTAARRITITNTGAADLVLEEFVGRNHVSLREDPKRKRVVEPGGTLSVEITASPGDSEGIFQGYLQIRNNSVRRVLTVPVYGYVSDRYMLKPEYRGQAAGPSGK